MLGVQELCMCLRRLRSLKTVSARCSVLRVTGLGGLCVSIRKVQISKTGGLLDVVSHQGTVHPLREPQNPST